MGSGNRGTRGMGIGGRRVKTGEKGIGKGKRVVRGRNGEWEQGDKRHGNRGQESGDRGKGGGNMEKGSEKGEMGSANREKIDWGQGQKWVGTEGKGAGTGSKGWGEGKWEMG